MRRVLKSPLEGPLLLNSHGWKAFFALLFFSCAENTQPRNGSFDNWNCWGLMKASKCGTVLKTSTDVEPHLPGWPVPSLALHFWGNFIWKDGPQINCAFPVRWFFNDMLQSVFGYYVYIFLKCIFYMWWIETIITLNSVFAELNK